MALQISAAHSLARLAGTLAFADAGVQNSRIRLYATQQPNLGQDPGDLPLVEILLAKPCGDIGPTGLQLIQAQAGGDMVSMTGAAVWARWINGNEEIVADGVVSDGAGVGDFKLAGTTGTQLYAGARALLGQVTLL